MPINWWHFVDRRCIDILSHGRKCTAVGGGDRIHNTDSTCRIAGKHSIVHMQLSLCLLSVLSVNLFRKDLLLEQLPTKAASRTETAKVYWS